MPDKSHVRIRLPARSNTLARARVRGEVVVVLVVGGRERGPGRGGGEGRLQEMKLVSRLADLNGPNI